MRSFLLAVISCLLLCSCQKSEDNPDNIILSHKIDTAGGRLILKGPAFDQGLTNYTVLFNDRVARPSRLISENEMEVIIPVHARTGTIKVRVGDKSYQSLDTFYLSHQLKWKEAAPFPKEGRILATAFVIGTRAYVTTGSTKYSGKYFRDLWEYDSMTDKWSQKADFPGATRYMSISFVLDGKGYVGGGIISQPYDCARDLYEYSPETNIWKKMADPLRPDDICYGTAMTYRGKGFILSEREGRSTVVYNSLANSWTRRGSVNAGIITRNGCSFVMNDKIYYGLGTAQIPWSGSGSFVSSSLFSYDYDSDTWSQESQSVPSDEQTTSTNAFVYGDEAYISFGDAGNLYAYNPQSKKWRSVVKQYLGIASDCSTFMIGSRSYTVFGHKRFEDPGSNRLWVIDLNTSPFVR
ncbi:MAG TPA: hypothetical protein VK541_23305 [Pedobacter sp.]|uniref:Kelch repeat-containing protein n=1 Tax=Pedobacter sp. TaxID=1411316 RepID=UPI002C3CA18A|nr:hypothetical protein [Pedobacter sp.]HMI05435.1 hypothetical protein [Pedobacter sp.]